VPRGDRTGQKWAWADQPGPSLRWFGPLFLEREDESTLNTWRLRHSEGERSIHSRGHPQDREGEEEGDHS
jgi:hypothetical protein